MPISLKMCWIFCIGNAPCPISNSHQKHFTVTIPTVKSLLFILHWHLDLLQSMQTVLFLCFWMVVQRKSNMDKFAQLLLKPQIPVNDFCLQSLSVFYLCKIYLQWKRDVPFSCAKYVCVCVFAFCCCCCCICFVLFCFNLLQLT